MVGEPHQFRSAGGRGQKLAVFLVLAGLIGGLVGPRQPWAQPESADHAPRPLVLALANAATSPASLAFPIPTARERVIEATLTDLAIRRGVPQLSLPTGQMVALPTASSSGWTTNGRAIREVKLGGAPGIWDVTVQLERQTSDGPRKSGEMLLTLSAPLDLSTKAYRLSGELRVPPELIGSGSEEYITPMRARWVMRDVHGRRCFGPNTACSLVPDQWIPVAALRPTQDAPIPKGLMEEGFDPSAVSQIGLNLEAGNLPNQTGLTTVPRTDYQGQIQVRKLTIEPVVGTPVSHPLSLRPLYRSAEDEHVAAPAVWETLRRRLGLRPGEMAVMVNMPWPLLAGRYHLYGISLGVSPWGEHWGFSFPATTSAVLSDLRFLKAHGIRVVRVFLFGDFRAGLEYDAAGRPVRFARHVYEDMSALLALCRQEQMLLIPSLVDFLVADGVSREGPGLQWAVGERPELITNPERREALVRLLTQFVRDFNTPEVLMWELMNEPENAVAVATPEHFQDLQQFIQTLAASLHEEGILTTLGVRHLGDYRRFWRGAVDVPQVHHWRLLESVPNPYPLETPASSVSPLPCILGEVEPIATEDVRSLLDRLRTAGYLMVGFWSLRGHDGYAFQPISDEVRGWIETQARQRTQPPSVP